jgi:hypothetical protein
MGPALAMGGPTAAPSSLPYGLNNADAGYSLSMCSTMSPYMGVPEHHLRTPLEFLTTTSMPSSTDSTEGSDGWAGGDSAGLRNLEDPCQFVAPYDEFFGCSDSNEDDYDPLRECFHVEVEDIVLGDSTLVGQGIHTLRQQVLPMRPPRGLPCLPPRGLGGPSSSSSVNSRPRSTRIASS